MTRLSLAIRSDALRALQRSPGALRGALDGFFNKGSILVRGEMVQQIRRRQKPGGTGRLSNSVTSIRVQGGFAVGPTVNYAPFVDLPTRPHDIVPRRAKALVIPQGGRIGFTRGGRAFTARDGGGRGGVRFAKRVRHPGTKGMFFSRHTAEAVQQPLQRLLDGEVQVALRRVGVR